MIPAPHIILDYHSFFKDDPPKDPIDLIKNIPRNYILAEIAGLNYRLKPREQIVFDVSYDTQIKELKRFCIDEKTFHYYFGIYSKFKQEEKKPPLIFNRAGNLYAIELLISNNSLVEKDYFNMAKSEIWESILKFILVSNGKATSTKVDNELSKKHTLYDISVALLALNELMIETDPLITPFRGLKLVEYYLTDSRFKTDFEAYFNGLGFSAEYLIYHITIIRLNFYF